MQNGSEEKLPRGSEITAFHRACLDLTGWPREQARLGRLGHADVAGSVWRWIEANHRCNSCLWNEEDLARRTRVSDSEIAANKRAIDQFNQARNDATERMDEALLLALRLIDPAAIAVESPLSTHQPQARLNSETAGSVIDRLSILSLKVAAMTEQARRSDVDRGHREASRARLARLQMQRDDLARCFDELVADCRAGRAYFKVYRQFKMYNDPRFNPVLVAEQRQSAD